jgi:hypothetical protein
VVSPALGDERDGMTLGEVARALADLRDEIRALRGEHVRRDLYEAHRAAMEAEVARLRQVVEGDRLDRAALRRSVVLAVSGAALSLLVQLVVTLVR